MGLVLIEQVVTVTVSWKGERCRDQVSRPRRKERRDLPVLHAGVRHDGAGAVQEELESKRGEKLGGRESSWKSGGDEHVFIAGR
jgi:hypothetical protein